MATDSLSRVFAEKYQDTYNLTIPEWRVLAIVAEFGTLSPTMVGQRGAMDKVKVSRATQSLVAKGLLRQSPDPRDGRGRLLRLTRKGASTHAGVVPLAAKLGGDRRNCFKQISAGPMSPQARRVSVRMQTRLETTNGSGARPSD